MFARFVLSTCLSLFIGAGLSAQQLVLSHVDFRDLTLDEAISAAATEGKGVLALIARTESKTYQRLLEEVYTVPTAAQAINEQFVAIRLDSSRALCPKGACSSQQVFLDGEGQVHHLTRGFIDADSIQYIAGAYLTDLSIVEARRRYASGERGKAFMHDYLIKLELHGEMHREAFRAYIDAFSDDELNTKEGLHAIYRFIAFGTGQLYASTKDRSFRHLMEKEALYAQEFGEDTVAGRLNYLVIASLDSLLDTDLEEYKYLATFLGSRDITRYNSYYTYKGIRPSMMIVIAPRVSFWLNYYEKVNDPALFRQFVLDAVTEHWNQAEEIAALAKAALDHQLVDDLKKIESWARRSLELAESYEGYRLLAKVYQTKGDKTKALELYQTSLEHASAWFYDTTEVEELIEELRKSQ